MALIEETLFGTVDKVHDAIERLRAFEPKDKPYWLAFSGGKDSVCILELAKMAGVNYEAHYSVTSVDPPELVRFIKEKYPEVSSDIPHDKNGKPVTMWSLIKSKPFPPTRTVRYCCEKLKESNGKGTITITGVRWAESVNRKLNQGIAVIAERRAYKIEEIKGVGRVNRAGGIVMNDDNDEARRAVEVCYRTNKTLVNPIIDWTDEDVWEFIHKYSIPYCELYDHGMTRIGCIGCPMAPLAEREEELNRYPKYKQMYLRTFTKMLQISKDNGFKYRNDWRTGQDIMDWWLSGKSNVTQEDDDLLFEYEDAEGEL